MKTVIKFEPEEKIKHDPRSDCQLWLTSRMKTTIMKRDTLLQKWVKNPTIENGNGFENVKNESTNMIRNAKRKLIKNKLEFNPNPKRIYAILKSKK